MTKDLYDAIISEIGIKDSPETKAMKAIDIGDYYDPWSPTITPWGPSTSPSVYTRVVGKNFADMMEVGMREPFIKKVIFNPPATIVFWRDGTKTVVKANNEPFDWEKGLAMAYVKKSYGNNKGRYYKMFKRFQEEGERAQFGEIVDE